MKNGMFVCVACRNGPEKGIMAAKGAEHAEGTYKSDPKSQRAFAGGACGKIECGKANGFKMGTGSFPKLKKLPKTHAYITSNTKN